MAEAEAEGQPEIERAPSIEFLHGQPYWSDGAMHSTAEAAFVAGLVLGLLIGLIALALYAAGL